MLVLTRKVGDVIAIGDSIKIVVMAIKGKQVRLGVQADKNTVVHREEVYQKIQREIRAAMQSDMQNAIAADSLLKSATDAANSQTAPKPKHTIIRKSEVVTDDEDDDGNPPSRKSKAQ